MAIRKKITVAVLIGFLMINIFIMQTSVSFAAENLKDNPQDNYEKVIAHGGGAYKGFETTNSVEALNYAIKNGYKIIELDMELSSDHKIIMLHDWDRTAMHYYGSSFRNRISQSQFLNLSVYGELEVLTFDKLAKILEKNREIRIVSDTKGDNLELLTAMAEAYPALTDRIIPQIYEYEQWSQVKALGFDDIIFTLYAMPEIDIEKLSSFVMENGIYAVTMPDYLAEKDLCRQLSADGIKVYVHPVSSFEDAQQFIKQGAYGVYSGTLLPEEFTGFERDYYLSIKDGSGTVTKLSDDRIDDGKELIIHGLKAGETVSYFIDNSRQGLSEQDIAMLEPGKHKLTLKIFNKKELLGSIDYFLWKDPADIRVLHKKYEYRLDAVKQEKEFSTVMTEADVPIEIRQILEQSLIAKKGEYVFYNNGNLENYMNGEEFLPVQTGSFGKLLLPLSTTAQRLGASSVTMSKSKDIAILYNGEQNLVMAGSCMIRKGYRITRIKTPVILYLNKAMAGGEFYQCITGRNFLEEAGIIIILPNGLKLDENRKNQILQSAGNLF